MAKVSKELFANDPNTTLNGAVSSTGATTLTVTSASKFPATGNFTIRVDNEYLLVTGVSGAVFTVSRGQEGSTAATHLDLAPVALVITDGSLRRLSVQSHNGTIATDRREVNYVDGGGVTWTLTDDPTNDRVALSATAGGGGTPEATYTVPVLTDYTWVNQGSATAVDDGKGIYLTSPAASQNNMKLLVIATGSTPWSYVAKVAPAHFNVNSPMCGVLWCVGTAGGRMHTLRYKNDGSIDCQEWASPTSYAAQDLAAINLVPGSTFRWVKVANNSTNIILSVSNDGLNWITLKSDLTTSYIGDPFDHVGFYVEAPTATWPGAAKLLSSKLN